MVAKRITFVKVCKFYMFHFVPRCHEANTYIALQKKTKTLAISTSTVIASDRQLESQSQEAKW